MRKNIVVGSRGSRLALVQAESVVAKLKAVTPEVEISVSVISTQGDKSPHVRLDEAVGSGFFVKELEEALLDRRIDLAVHSLKDVPTELPEGLMLAAVPERSDPRDVLVTVGTRFADLPCGEKIGTGSLRRSLQLAALRPDLKSANIRGNVDTRIGKVDSGEYGGLITAAAALIRLGLRDRITHYFDTENFLPAVGQGALVVESRKDDDELNCLLSKINEPASWYGVTAERAFLLALGGGCQAPIAALASVDNGDLRIRGLVASQCQQKMLRANEAGTARDAVEIGERLAKKLLDQGAGEFIEEAKLR